MTLQDSIGTRLFNMPFDELSEEQKDIVEDRANFEEDETIW